MQLGRLIEQAGLTGYVTGMLPDVDVPEVRYDSRRVQAGDVFVAVPGTATDGHRYIAAAIARGASAVVLEQADRRPPGHPFLLVPSSRAALADLAAAGHHFPARRLFVTGITGTDGKTTSCFLLSHLLEGLGRRSGLIGTVAIKVGERWEDNLSRQSTPESPEVQASLAAMAGSGVAEAVVEATSHGLVLQRVRRCAFDAALITNVTSDHLDFHTTRQGYLEAKALLLAALAEREGKPGTGLAAINLDDEGSAGLISRSPAPVVTFGLQAPALLRAVEVRTGADGSTFTLEVEGRRFSASTPLPGLFNIYNCLGVLALLHGRGCPVEAALPHLATFAGVPGRMQLIDAGQPFAVIVDYAHTADSLAKVLRTVRPLTRGKLIVVFGCAGGRDREKRPIMGGVAARLADYAVLTDEDPRSEPSEAIIAAIAAGAVAAGAAEGHRFEREPDRRRAIARATALAKPGDLVLLAGKGHEHSMLVGSASLPWDEEGAAREALLTLGYGR